MLKAIFKSFELIPIATGSSILGVTIDSVTQTDTGVIIGVGTFAIGTIIREVKERRRQEIEQAKWKQRIDDVINSFLDAQSRLSENQRILWTELEKISVKTDSIVPPKQ